MYKINTEGISGAKRYIWHYRKDNREYGPFTYEDIADMVRRGDIGLDDYVFKFGDKKFIKASEVRELADLFQKPEEKPEEEKEEQAETVSAQNEVIHTQEIVHPQVKSNKESSGLNIALIIGGVLLLGLIAWGIILFV